MFDLYLPGEGLEESFLGNWPSQQRGAKAETNPSSPHTMKPTRWKVIWESRESNYALQNLKLKSEQTVSMARHLLEASNIKDQDQTDKQIQAAGENIKVLKKTIINILREIR